MAEWKRPGRGLIRLTPTKGSSAKKNAASPADFYKANKNDSGREFEYRRYKEANDMFEKLTRSRAYNTSIVDDSSDYGAAAEELRDDETITFSLDGQNNDLKSKTDLLFMMFLEIIQGRHNDLEVFDTIAELAQVCSDVQDEVHMHMERHEMNSMVRETKFEWLREEARTWRLLGALYKDRILVQDAQNQSENDAMALGGSEKEVITWLYEFNSALREYQMVVDWLEASYSGGMQADIHPNPDLHVSFENTLAHLKHPKRVAFGNATNVVTHVDPDAALRENRRLHTLDEEDNKRLAKGIFQLIRKGCFEDAITLCKRYGQMWRAAVLEGWRLHEDPNFETPAEPHAAKKHIEGNPQRDIWKRNAWLMSDSKKLDDYTRATLGALCGNLSAMKTVVNNNYEDYLWAMLKTQIDICVEDELRVYCLKKCCAMPAAYWDAKMTMPRIFEELCVHQNPNVREHAQQKMTVVQKYLILDEIPELLEKIEHWLQQAESGNTDDADITKSPHMMRFLTHVVLFMRQFGRIRSNETADRIIAVYVERLIEMGDSLLVAYYAGSLPSEQHVPLYSKYLETINEHSARLTALQDATRIGLDLQNITIHTVKNMRLREPPSNEPTPKSGSISNFNALQIGALDWLTYIKTQRGELLWHANAMCRRFLAENKTECVRAVLEKIPSNTIATLVDDYGGIQEFPCREECTTKEYICYQYYIKAVDAFNDWKKLCQNEPIPPPDIDVRNNFMQRCAHELLMKKYIDSVERWKFDLKDASKYAHEKIYEVLHFPDCGWLIDPIPEKNPVGVTATEWINRQVQLEKLRSIYVPQVVLMLYELLYASARYKECIQIAVHVADEHRQLYKCFTKHKLSELMLKMADASQELLNAGLDAFGFVPTI